LNYTIRVCRTLDDLAACVSLQRTIWGYAEHELYPMRLFVNLGRIGGHVLGAFSSGNQLVGFVGSMPAWHGRRRYVHSLSLGVLPEDENRGLGRTLKLAQRKAALRSGVDLIEWTFDPLRPKNAFFNIVRLGAIVRKYLRDYYGRVESRFQQGLASDRLVAEWWLKSPRVRRALAGKDPRAAKTSPAAEVPVPGDIDSLVQSQPRAALARQTFVRRQFRKFFARELLITGFSKDDRGPRYLLDRAGEGGLPRQA